MYPRVSTAGRVCLCEWSGPVTVTMVVSLLSQLQQLSAPHRGTAVLILHVAAPSARSIMRRSSTFLDVMPTLWAYCQEIIVACPGESRTLDQLRRALCGSASMPIAGAVRPFTFFEHLDDALTYAQDDAPHEILELRRQRLRSGTWILSDGETRHQALR
jgi:hypothetical protein